jgi:hypothetical protein
MSSTTTGTAVAGNFDYLEDVKVVVSNDAYSGYSAGTAEWNWIIQFSPDNSNWFNASASVMVVSATAASVERKYTRQQIKALSTSPILWARIVLTKVGTPGTLTLDAYITTEE